jgi:hypothetical protein
MAQEPPLTGLDDDQEEPAEPPEEPEEPVSPEGADTDKMRVIWGGVIILGSFLLIGFVIWFLSRKFPTAKDVNTVLASVTGTIGTIIGAFFGLQIGAAGTARAERGRKDAERARRRSDSERKVERVDRKKAERERDKVRRKAVELVTEQVPQERREDALRQLM